MDKIFNWQGEAGRSALLELLCDGEAGRSALLELLCGSALAELLGATEDKKRFMAPSRIFCS